MCKIIRTLQKKGKSHALLESPTGSGKSMAILCGALAWLETEKLRKKKLQASLKIGQKARLSQPASVSTQLAAVSAALADDTEQPSKKARMEGEGADEELLGLEAAGLTDEQLDALTPVPKIYFASRTHKQLGQLVKELRRSGYAPKFTVLGSRQQYCINESVRRQKDINEACKEHFKECVFTKKLPAIIDKFNAAKLATNMDIEDLVRYGKAEKACSYFLSREVTPNADIVFAPYNYIMDPGIRSAMQLKLDGAVVIIDEAHNIEDTCRSAGSFEITADALGAVQTELNVLLSGVGDKAVKNPEGHRALLHVATIFHTWMSTNAAQPSSIKLYEEKCDIYSDKDIPETLKQLGVVPETLSKWSNHVDAIMQQSSQAANTRKKTARGDDDDEVLLSTGSCRVFTSLFHVLGKMLIEGGDVLASYRMVRIQKVKAEKMGRKLDITLGFWCLSPDVIFRPLCNQVKSIILTSGTLSPMGTFASELHTKFDERLEALHIINPEQVWVGCLPTSPQGLTFIGNFKNMETFQFQDELARCVMAICEKVPYGVLCFLPSYAFLDKMVQRMKTTGMYDQLSAIKRVFLEPRQGSAKEFEGLMRRYYDCIRACKEGVGFTAKSAKISGALFFAVYRGKVSEGLDLADENCRAVIPVGIPYPAFKDQKVILKRDYNDKHTASKHILNGHAWYETQAFRALNQALGRCIRHRLDWGAIILLEQRFTYANNTNQLSKWVRARVLTHPNFGGGMASLERFVNINQAKELEVSAELEQIQAHMHAAGDGPYLEDDEEAMYAA